MDGRKYRDGRTEMCGKGNEVEGEGGERKINGKPGLSKGCFEGR